MLAAITLRKSRSRATARKPVPPGVRRRDIREVRIRDRCEHDQREGNAGDGVEDVERLEPAEVLDRADDEAGDRRAAADAEVAGNAAEPDHGGALLRGDQGEAQHPVRGIGDAEPGAADGRADEGLPGTVDEREARVTEPAGKAAGDQDRLGAETIDQAHPMGGVMNEAMLRPAASISPAVAVGKPRARWR